MECSQRGLLASRHSEFEVHKLVGWLRWLGWRQRGTGENGEPTTEAGRLHTIAMHRLPMDSSLPRPRRGMATASVACLLLMASSVASGDGGPWAGGGGRGGGGGGGVTDDFNQIVDWIDKYANMSPAQQSLVLLTAGFAIQAKTGMDCNMFGGTPACKAVDPASSYVQQCGKQAEPKVDCTTYMDVNNNLYDSPVDDLQDYLATTLGPQVKEMCPQCFERVQALWCALAVPACGTFNVLVQRGILPILGQAVKTYRNSASSSRADAVASIMGAALDVGGVGLPCRDMCEAMEATCSCGGAGSDTLGSLLTWLASQPQLKASSKLPTMAYGRVLFKDVWDRPFCSLFPERSSQPPGGRCSPAPPAACSSRTEWCAATQKGANTDTFKYAQSLLLLQLLRATTGWITNDNAIIWGVHSSINDAVTTASTTDGDAIYAPGLPPHHMSAIQICAVVFLSLTCFGLMSVGAVAGFRYYKAKYAERNYFQLTEKENFVSLPTDI